MTLTDIKGNLFKTFNISITFLKSVKFSNSHIQHWVQHVLRPAASEHYLLISDYWGGQRDPALYSQVNGCHRMEIPPKTTSICQPLDCFFNRQWKYFIRRLFDRIQLDQVPINLSERNNIIKLNSLIYNQLSAIVFKKLIFFSWFIAGYRQTSR